MTQRDKREKLALADYRDKAYERLHALAGSRATSPRWDDIATLLRERDELYEQLRTPAPADGEAHAEIQRLQDAKRRALAIADERAKENVALILAAQAVVHDYPIAAGTAKWDTEGGYGSIRDLRLALDALAPTATDTPDEGPDPLGYAKGERT